MLMIWYLSMMYFNDYLKNAMSVAATVYATDCVARMVMDVVPSEVKEGYIDPALNYIYEAADYGVANLIETSNTVINYFDQNSEL
jgi:hypothetical protein